MFEKALVVEAVIVIFLFGVYKVYAFVNSDARKRKLIEKQIRLEQEKEEKREAFIQEKIQNNENRFKELSRIAIMKKEKDISNHLENIEISKELQYDYETKELPLEELKTYYEDQIEKMKEIQIESAAYVPRLPFALLKLYKWYSYSNEIASFFMDEIKTRGFDIIGNMQKIMNDAVTFQKEFNQRKKEVEKKYHFFCTIEKERKKVNKELERFKENVIKLSGVKYVIDEKTIKFDNVIITENGIFCVIIKDLNQQNIEQVFVSEDEKWTVELENGERYHVDPIDGEYHKNIEMFQKMLNQRLKERYQDEDTPYLMIYPLIVLTEENIFIENESTIPIKKISSLFNHIQLFKGSKVPVEYLKDLEEIISNFNIRQNTESVDDNISFIEKNGVKLNKLLKSIDLVDECVSDYCILIEERKIIKAYRQYLAYEKLMKHKKSVEDAHIVHFLNTQNKDKHHDYSVQDPLAPLIKRLVEPCLTNPIKILARILDLSMLKSEYILKEMYSVKDWKEVQAVSFQYINRAMLDIISSNVPEDIIQSHLSIETYNNLKLYKIAYFELE